MIIRMQAAAFVLTLLAVTAHSQSLEGGWSDIEPLRTEKTNVEKKLGVTKTDASGYYYELGNGIVMRINFSTTPCAPVHYDRDKYDIPRNTVLDYVVYFNNPMLLSDLRFKPGEFSRRVDDHRPTDYVLVNEKAGITIVGYYRQDLIGEYVSQIYFKPNLSIKEKRRCKD